MNTNTNIINFVDNFESNGDGFETPDDIASGFFNSPAEIDDTGDVWLENCNCWATEERLEDFAQWLKDNNHC
jgi:hypothetical protein